MGKKFLIVFAVIIAIVMTFKLLCAVSVALAWTVIASIILAALWNGFTRK